MQAMKFLTLAVLITYEHSIWNRHLVRRKTFVMSALCLSLKFQNKMKTGHRYYFHVVSEAFGNVRPFADAFEKQGLQ